MPVVYPSGLFLHCNVDVHGKVKILTLTHCADNILDIEFVITDGEWPTKHNSRPMKDDQFGRGSIVFFNQATMLQSSESGFMTLKQAAAAGASTTSNYDEIVVKCFLALAALSITQK